MTKIYDPRTDANWIFSKNIFWSILNEPETWDLVYQQDGSNKLKNLTRADLEYMKERIEEELSK